MIRPSGMQVAELCGASRVLAEQYPQSSIYAERGTKIHEEISTRNPVSPEAKAALKWLLQKGWDAAEFEVKVRVEDPETGELLSEGTSDVVFVEDDPFSTARLLNVGDWKTGRAKYVTASDQNLQILTYGVGLALEREVDAFQGHLLFLDGDKVDARSSKIYHQKDWWPLLERIKAATRKSPVPVTGPHCSDLCWSRLHCPAYLLPVHEGPTVLEPFTVPEGLTPDNAARALMTVEAIEEVADLARAQLKEFVERHGPIRVNGKEWGPIPSRGKRSGPSVKELEAKGLAHLIKEGQPFERWDWKKVG